jgi:hypothetical protein
MDNPFIAELLNNRATRKFGGSTVGVATPYIQGYHFIWFTRLPPDLKKYTQMGANNIKSDSEISSILSAACLSVDPPGIRLNKVEFSGLGGTKWNAPGGIDHDTELTVKFLEFTRTPIHDIIFSWVKMIRDYRTGTAGVDVPNSKAYSADQYAGTMLYWTTAPDAQTVEFYACYDGVFPTIDPQNGFNSDIENIGKVEHSITFNVDWIWHEPWVRDACMEMSAAFYGNIVDASENHAIVGDVKA